MHIHISVSPLFLIPPITQKIGMPCYTATLQPPTPNITIHKKPNGDSDDQVPTISLITLTIKGNFSY
jgi:hypothetical protein